MTRRLPSIGRDDREPVAIVGIGCRFPGASNPAAFWQLLVDGVDAIREIPRERFDVDALYDERPAQPGKVHTRWGGFVDGLDQLDAEFFGISPREAERLDPQQRMLLETAWEAVEDAGMVPSRLTGSATGVFVGMWINEYESRLFRNQHAIDFYMTTGTGRYAASGRLSYFFGLHGPSLTLDTGCSSSLVAVHLACQSLWSGESELALAGAANAIVEPFVTIAYSQSGMMAPDGRCKFGDAAANGYVRSDGAAIVVLKPLSKAIADGNPIYATILGSAVTNDGRSSGFMTTPAREGQEEMLRRAYRDAGVSPGRVQFVEAHGTGTRAGDPVELGALGSVLAMDRPVDQPCRVGSVKTNIGHTEGAAGMAGLVKTALSLKHRTIPANLHLCTPNPDIPWAALPLVLQQQTEPWPSPEPALAGVSSFGISGTNAHVVLGEAPPRDPSPTGDRPAALTISGHTPDALRAMVSSWRDAIATAPQASLVDLSFSAAARRAHHNNRAAFAADSVATVLDQMAAFLAGESSEGVSSGQVLSSTRVAFVFPGQGSQWWGMGRGLYAAEPVFRAAFDACDAAIAAETGRSVKTMLIDEAGDAALQSIDVIQPALFAIQVSLAALWTSWGVRPDAVVGHSMGEVAAAYVAGALSLADAARVICLRSRLMKRTSGRGAMAVVELAAADTAKEIAGRERELSLAVCNSSRSTVLSGDPAALDAVLGSLESRGIFCRRVKVDVASHSPQMDPLCGELFEGLAGIQPHEASISFRSTAVAGALTGKDLDAAYWVKNLRNPVMFGEAVQELCREKFTVFVEMSPHPILTGAVRECIVDEGVPAVSIGSTKREEDERLSILASLGAAYVSGVAIDWDAVYPGCTGLVPMPLYAFQRERFWFDVAPSAPAHVARPATRVNLGGALFVPEWTEIRRDSPATTKPDQARFLLLGDSELSRRIEHELRVRGVACESLSGSYSTLPAQPSATGFTNVVFAAPATAVGDHADAAIAAAWDLVRYARDLAASGDTAPALTVITRTAHRVVESDRVAGFTQGLLWGVHRAVVDEYPDLDGGLLDIADDTSAGSIAAELLLESSDQVALRGDARFVLRLRPAEIAADPDAFMARTDAAYFISGGLGDLGLEVANWLADRGARRLILAGRTALPRRAEWLNLAGDTGVGRRVSAIRALESKGVAVHLAALDVGDETALKGWLKSYRDEAWPAIRGVVHCAGILEPHLVPDTDLESLQRVLRPKVAGTLALQRAFSADPLDIFLLFSSIAAILPAPGQVSYAAANAFLDSFSQYRRASGRHAVAINWAAWTNLGMAAALGAAEQTSSRGVARLSIDQARAALDTSVHSSVPQLAVAPFVAAEWTSNVFPPSIAAYQATVFDTATDAPPLAPAERSLQQVLRDLDSATARRDYLDSWVRGRVAAVLGRLASRIDVDRPLRGLGLDSLMGLQLRNEFEKALSEKLPATIVWNYPTVSALSAYLATRMDVAFDEPVNPAARAPEADLDALLEEIAALPEDEARRLLAEHM